MPLARIVFKPGVNRETTSYGSENGWYESDLIRFRKGRPEKMGGWSRLSSTSFQGTGRSLHVWAALDNSQFMGLGTEFKFYIEQGGGYNDITPVRKTVSLGNNPFLSTAGNGIITVTDIAHGAVVNDFVIYSGSVGFDGLLASAINRELQITQVIDSNSYKVNTGGVATSGSVAGGGASISAEYQINTGLNTVVSGTGFGAGFWGGITSSYSAI